MSSTISRFAITLSYTPLWRAVKEDVLAQTHGPLRYHVIGIKGFFHNNISFRKHTKSIYSFIHNINAVLSHFIFLIKRDIVLYRHQLNYANFL